MFGMKTLENAVARKARELSLGSRVLHQCSQANETGLVSSAGEIPAKEN